MSVLKFAMSPARMSQVFPLLCGHGSGVGQLARSSGLRSKCKSDKTWNVVLGRDFLNDISSTCIRMRVAVQYLEVFKFYFFLNYCSYCCERLLSFFFCRYSYLIHLVCIIRLLLDAAVVFWLLVEST